MADLSAHHVGITVSDLEGTLSFYRDDLGLSVVERFELDDRAFSEAVGIEGAHADFAHLDAGGAVIELVEYDPEARGSPAAGLNQPGASHVGFAVDDLDAFYDALPEAEDVPTISGPRTTGSGTPILFLRDPEGNLIEVLEA